MVRLTIEREVNFFNQKSQFLLKKIENTNIKVLSIKDPHIYDFFEPSENLDDYSYIAITNVKITKSKLNPIRILEKIADGAMILTPSGKTILPWNIDITQNISEVYIYRYDIPGKKKDININMFFNFLSELREERIRILENYIITPTLQISSVECVKNFPEFAVLIQDKIVKDGYIYPWFDVFIIERCTGKKFEKIYSVFGKHPNVYHGPNEICYGKNDVGRLDLMDMNLDSAYPESKYYKYNPIKFISSLSKYILQLIK